MWVTLQIGSYGIEDVFFANQVVGKYTCENEVAIDDEEVDDGKSVLKTLDASVRVRCLRDHRRNYVSRWMRKSVLAMVVDTATHN